MSLQVSSGDDLRKLRRSCGLTQKEIAHRAGLSQSLIARIEAGKVDPRLSTLKKILNAMKALEAEKTATQIMHSPVIFIRVSESVHRAVDLMEEKCISQLPVVDRGKVVGSVQEGTLIAKILQNKDLIFSSTMREVMEEPFPMVTPNASMEEVLALFTRERPAVLVMDRDRFLGIITKIDVIKALRAE